MTDLEKIEEKYGTRPRIPMGHGEPLLKHHAKIMLDQYSKAVWCPVGFIMSWSAGDYDHEYCPWCKEFFKETK